MKNWKELGEVPDSDDASSEGFDLEQSQLSDVEFPPVDAILPSESPGTSAKENIWDIPSSPRVLNPYALSHIGLGTTLEGPDHESVAFPEAEDGDNHDEITLVAEFGQTSENEAASQHTPRNARRSVSILHGEVSRSDIQAAALLLGPTAASSPLSTLTSPPSSRASLSRDASPISKTPRSNQSTSQTARTSRERDQITESRSFAVGLERSLRPRKPIQQHPYLLESAQYANLMKSRGVKPVKVAPRPEQETQHPEEDSQDRDFETEESQELSGEGRNGLIDNSGLIISEEGVRDIDELTRSASPRTSSVRPRPQSSSQQHDEDTDATSVENDDDMPSLEDMLRNPAVLAKGAKRQRSRQVYSGRKRQKTLPQVSPSSSPPRGFIPPHRLSSPSTGPRDTLGPPSNLRTTPLSPLRT